MDTLSALLEGMSPRGTVFCHGEVRAPWCFEGGAEGVSLFHCVVEGSAWLTRPGAKPRRLDEGDVVMLPRGGSHRMGSRTRGPSVPLGEAVARTSPDAPFARFTRHGDGTATRLICGSFVVAGEEWHPLMSALPAEVVVNAGVARWLAPTLAALGRYLQDEEPGATLVTQRLTEILFVQVVAAWLDGTDAPPGWLQAFQDPSVGRAMAAIHREPGAPWTVNRLSRRAGMSRSAFHQRFAALVGESPARYLKRWRMTIAARALRETRDSVETICERVGYVSVPSFSKAFREHHGLPPGAFRRAATLP